MQSNQPATNQPIQLLRPTQVAKALGIGLSTFWLWRKTDPNFPQLIGIGARARAIRADDLQKYVDGKASKGVSHA